MKQFVTEVLTQFQKGQITLQEATDRLISEKAQDRKAKSNRRLKNLSNALQRERNPAKVRELKNRLSQEFYHGDRLSNAENQTPKSAATVDGPFGRSRKTAADFGR